MSETGKGDDVERVRQACRSICGDGIADPIMQTLGLHWAVLAALADPRGDGTEAREVLREWTRRNR